MNDVSIYHRQELWFGIDGQEKLENIRVGIVGIGGTGSHVLQQLAYLGVKHFILIDPDSVRETNLNRLIGANIDDKGKSKVEIGERLIKFINKNADVKIIQGSFIGVDGIRALKGCDFIFGCVDKDGARLLLTEFSKAYEKPYLDIATEITENNWGGRIVFTDSELGCLVCREQLSKEEIQHDLSTPEERSINDRIYGVSIDKLKGTGPSVVSLNGLIASLAVTEFLVQITDLRPARRYLEYRDNMGLILSSKDELPTDCYYCVTVKGIGDKADLERYARQGIDKILR